MNTSGEAADQVMRMMLNGTEVLLKLTGTGVMHVSTSLFSTLRQQKRTRGRARLETMLKSGKPLKVYTFRDRDLQKFKEVAKQYGVLYTILKEKDKTDGVFDVMVRAEDESKIARIVERFKIAQVNSADLRAEIVREKTQKEHTGEKTDAPESDQPEQNSDEKLADEILGDEGKTEEREGENPTTARTETERGAEGEEPQRNPSEHSSEPAKPNESLGLTEEERADRKPSVKKRLETIRRNRAERAKDHPKAPELAKGKGSKPMER